MKQFILCLMALVAIVCSASAQRLTLLKRYGQSWGTEQVTMKNKPNGIIYRLRVEKQCDDLPPVPETKGLELFIAEPTDMGWLGFYRLPTSANQYDFVVVLYDHSKQPVTTVNLCDITNNRYCEVQDVRWDSDTHHLLFNMACPSYASQIDGKGSKLYCYDVEQHRLVWQTDYLVSNDIFILNDNYVFCSYGFTSEKKYLYMLDKFTGRIYSKLPMVKKVEYIELQQKNGKEVLYAVDYDNNLFTYAVPGKPQRAATQQGEVLTVVYATSDDYFLNVRAQPSSRAAIIDTLWMQSHGLGSGVLRQYGDQWSKISVGSVTGWVYTKYMGTQSWYDGTGRNILVAARENTPIYGENYVGEDDYPLFTTVKKGTILADEYDEIEGYYVLKTGHDYLFIKKSDAEVKPNNR
ncbi:MAG: SH3 domain-containing protein [Prevotella sp.]|nr:SH3 domain-containing protein [Prevotella sp.]